MIYGLISLFLCVGIPLAYAVYFLLHRNGSFYTFLAGAGCFALFQLAFRIPLLNAISRRSDWISLLPYTNPLLYGALLAVTAGIFEETGRWIFLRYLCRNKHEWIHGFSFGLGHGGIEAIWVSTLGIIPAFLNGTIVFAGPDTILVGVERVCTMLFHIAMSLLVLHGVRKKQFRFCLLAVLIHFTLDFSIVIPSQIFIWCILGFSAILSLAFIIYNYHIYRKKGDQTL